MKKYVKTLLIGIIILVVLDYATGQVLRFLYFNAKSGVIQETTFSIQEAETEILILGSSRAKHHYDSRLIEEISGLEAYNTGRDGSYIFYHAAVLKSALARYKPQQIILDFAGSFKENESDYDRLSSLLPYYQTNKELQEIIELKSPFEKYKLISKIYPYNSLLTTIIAGNIGFDNGKQLQTNGYDALSGEWESSLDSIKTESSYQVDVNKHEIFEEIIILAKQNDIPLLVIFSPVYYLYKNDYSLDICRKICEKHGIEFLDFSKDPNFLNKKNLFKDQTHLNETGATIFTQIIADKISS